MYVIGFSVPQKAIPALVTAQALTGMGVGGEGTEM
jgi:hypothetical protein